MVRRVAPQPRAPRGRASTRGQVRRPGLPEPSLGGTAPYKPIGDYGIIGNLRTVALVGIDGSIDWYCHPHFDSPSVFAAILDARRGGRFDIHPEEADTRKQLYLPGTNILITRFLSRAGVAELTDFMPLGGGPPELQGSCLVRRIAAIRGRIRCRVGLEPAFDYGRSRHRTLRFPTGAVFRTPELSLALSTSLPLRPLGRGLRSEFTLQEGESRTCVLTPWEPGSARSPPDFPEHDIREALTETTQWWRRWIARSKYRGRWREMIHRSALILKLLTFEPTGAIVAAPTCGLPEVVGGGRNWDYRYTWIRDAAFTLYALLRIGFIGEAYAFMGWLLGRTSDLEPDGSLHPVYRIDGSHELSEQTLDHLEGYRKSGPIRIGNAAVDQLQLDIYGALMDAVYLFNKHGQPISYDLWVNLRRILDWLTENWRRPDKGIWEVRSGPERFVYSNMMCWVALDRAIRIAEKRGFPSSLDRWRRTRDEIYEEVMREGWDEEAGAFVQHYGSKALDASALLMPLVFFLSPHDPRMARTLDAIQRDLVSDNLVHRYSPQKTPDGLRGTEGTFTLCSFWLVEALTRAGRLDEARLTFEKMLTYANHLGLYSEQIGPSGEALGNFPQAFTHLALISAAVNLDRALGESD
jgi:GH15 family glucan-1,4-alpha-glucosidase